MVYARAYSGWLSFIIVYNNCFSFLGELTDAQAKHIIEDHEKELEKSLTKFEVSKTRQLADLEKKLAEKRNKREQELREKHEQEAIQAGLPVPPRGRYPVYIT